MSFFKRITDSVDEKHRNKYGEQDVQRYSQAYYRRDFTGNSQREQEDAIFHNQVTHKVGDKLLIGNDDKQTLEDCCKGYAEVHGVEIGRAFPAPESNKEAKGKDQGHDSQGEEV